MFEDDPYYRRNDGAFFIWRHYTDTWRISNAPGYVADDWMKPAGDLPSGDYQPEGSYLGDATVSTGGH
ncbi:hypothetical protein ES703_40387 [subsurface metagenome]